MNVMRTFTHLKPVEPHAMNVRMELFVKVVQMCIPNLITGALSGTQKKCIRVLSYIRVLVVTRKTLLLVNEKLDTMAHCALFA